MNRGLGGTLILVGIVLIIAGAMASAGWLGWVGRLPGDIRVERGSTRVYVPLVSMLLLSLLLSVVMYLFRR